MMSAPGEINRVRPFTPNADSLAGKTREEQARELNRYFNAFDDQRRPAQAAMLEQEQWRRNRWRYNARIDEHGALGLQEQVVSADKYYHSIPLAFGLAQLRLARYLAFKPRRKARMRSRRERDRPVNDICDILLDNMIVPERERELPYLMDGMIYGAHHVLYVGWDNQGGFEVVSPVVSEKPTGVVISETDRVFRIGGRDYNVTEVAAKVVGRKAAKRSRKKLYQAVDESGRPMTESRETGGPRYVALGPDRFFFDPVAGARGVRFARWAGHDTRVTKDEVAEMFPDQAGALDSFLWSKETALSPTHRQQMQALGRTTEGGYGETATMRRVFMRPSVQFGFEKGLWLVMLIADDRGETRAGNSNLLVLRWGDLSTPGRKLPYFDGAVEVADGNDWYGGTLFRVTKDGQMQANLFWSLASEAAEVGNQQLILARGDTGDQNAVAASRIAGLPNGWLIQLPGTQLESARVHSTGSPSTQVALIEKLVDFMELASQTRGMRADREELAAQVARALEQDKTQAGVVVHRLDEMYQAADLFALRWCQQMMGYDDLRQALPEYYGYGEAELDDFYGADLASGMQLRTDGPGVSDDPALLMYLIKFLPQLGPAWQKLYPPEILSEMLNKGRKFGETPMDAHRRRAMLENIQLRRGPATVDMRDEHETHLLYHDLDYIDGLAFMQQDEKDRRREHADAHKDMSVAKLRDDAKLAAQKAIIMEQTKAEVMNAVQPQGVPGTEAPQEERRPAGRPAASPRGMDGYAG